MTVDSQTTKTYICQVSRHLTENDNDLLKLEKSKWTLAVASILDLHENGQ